MLVIIQIIILIVSLITSTIFFVLWKRTSKKLSLSDIEKKISDFKKSFNSIIDENLEYTKESAIEITKRFNALDDEIRFFNQKIKDADILLLKIDNVNLLIQNSLEKNIKRDEALVSLNKEIEDIKTQVSDNKTNKVVNELVIAIEETLDKIKKSEEKIKKAQKDIIDLTEVVSKIAAKL